MPFLCILLFVMVFFAAWVGHACIWTTLLNHVYARPYPKAVLRPWRHATGVVILAFPCFLLLPSLTATFRGETPYPAAAWEWAALGYEAVCLGFGVVLFPVITLRRLLRKPPAALVAESTETLDLWKELGEEVIGDGKGTRAARLPGNGIFRVDFTEQTLALPDLPAEWDGLTILFLSDIHFHGTPSQAFFERVAAEIERRWPLPDLVCLSGDYVDTDYHAAWIVPHLGRLSAREAKLAILGNHDQLYDPDRVRAELVRAGYLVLSNPPKDAAAGPRKIAIRGVTCTVVGHEGPWFQPDPKLPATSGEFRLCLSHTPDYFYWGQKNSINLMLCGHVHGGQIRIPVIGSIFVPSVYGRRFDMGVFEDGGTVMVVSKGLSGREPYRFRCNPQVTRLTLKSR